jgi:hypothetical protein
LGETGVGRPASEQGGRNRGLDGGTQTRRAPHNTQPPCAVMAARRMLTCVLLGVLLQHGGTLLVAAGRWCGAEEGGFGPHLSAWQRLTHTSWQASRRQCAACNRTPSPPAGKQQQPCSPAAPQRPLAHLRSPTVRFSLCTLRSTNSRWSPARLRSPYLQTAATGGHMARCAGVGADTIAATSLGQMRHPHHRQQRLPKHATQVRAAQPRASSLQAGRLPAACCPIRLLSAHPPAQAHDAGQVILAQPGVVAVQGGCRGGRSRGGADRSTKGGRE